MPLAIFCKMNNKVFQQELGSDVQKTTKENTGLTNEAVTKDRSKGMETVKVFFTDTTLHGARFMFAESLLRRCLWTLTLVVSLAFCYYQAYGTLKHYFEWPFNTRITSKSTLKNGLPFPAVTLCNFNPQNIHRIIHFQNASNNKEEIKRLKDASKVLTLSKGVLTDGFLKRYSDFFNGEKMERYWKLHSHQIEDMLLPNAPPTFVSCLFDGLVCGAENFTSFESSSFGQCFTFNSGQNGRALLNATVAGKNSGLKLRLNIQRDGYIDNPKKPYVGITVLVHDNYNFPFMDEYGFAVEPGTQTFCSIKMKKVSKKNSTLKNVFTFVLLLVSHVEPNGLIYCANLLSWRNF